MKTVITSRLCLVCALVLGIVVLYASGSPRIDTKSNLSIGGDATGECCTGTTSGESCYGYDNRCGGVVTTCDVGSSKYARCSPIPGSSPTCAGPTCPSYADAQCN